MATVTRNLNVNLNWSDPAVNFTEVDPFLIEWQLRIYSRNSNGAWVERHDTGVDPAAISVYNDNGGQGWQGSYGVEYEDDDPEEFFYVAMGWITLEIELENVEYYLRHNPTILNQQPICNSDDDASFYFGSWSWDTMV